MKRGVQWLIKRAAAGLFLYPGMGKTSITLAAFTTLKREGMAERLLVVAPKLVAQLGWSAEIEKWKEFKHLTYAIVVGPKKDKIYAQALADNVDVIITNFDSLPWLLNVTKVKAKNHTKISVDRAAAKRLAADVVVVDELSKCKNRTSIRSQILRSLRPYVSRIWGLTGSPAANGLMDLFGQMLVIDEGRALGQYITKYRLEFFNNPRQYVYEPKSDALDRIKQRLADTVMSLSEAEHLSLPPLIENDIHLELPAEHRLLYKALHKAMSVAIDEGRISPANAAVASGKCRQVASGAVYLTPEPEEPEDVLEALAQLLPTKKAGPKEWAHLHDVKLEALQDILDELQGQPLLIAYDFAHSLERLKKFLGSDVPVMGRSKDPEGLKRAWNNNEIPVMLGHPASIGHGLNLQEGSASNIFLFDMMWDFDQYDQLIRRLRRRGSNADKIIVHRPIMINTVEVDMACTLTDKKTGQEAVFDAFNLYRK